MKLPARRASRENIASRTITITGMADHHHRNTHAAKGDMEEALRLAAQDVVALNGFARSLGEAVSWGFARRPRPAALDRDRT